MTYTFHDASRRTVRLLGIAALALFGLNAYAALTRAAPDADTLTHLWIEEAAPSHDVLTFTGEGFTEARIERPGAARERCLSTSHEIRVMREIERIHDARREETRVHIRIR